MRKKKLSPTSESSTQSSSKKGKRTVPNSDNQISQATPSSTTSLPLEGFGNYYAPQASAIPSTWYPCFPPNLSFVYPPADAIQYPLQFSFHPSAPPLSWGQPVSAIPGPYPWPSFLAPTYLQPQSHPSPQTMSSVGIQQAVISPLTLHPPLVPTGQGLEEKQNNPQPSPRKTIVNLKKSQEIKELEDKISINHNQNTTLIALLGFKKLKVNKLYIIVTATHKENASTMFSAKILPVIARDSQAKSKIYPHVWLESRIIMSQSCYSNIAKEYEEKEGQGKQRAFFLYDYFFPKQENFGPNKYITLTDLKIILGVPHLYNAEAINEEIIDSTTKIYTITMQNSANLNGLRQALNRENLFCMSELIETADSHNSATQSNRYTSSQQFFLQPNPSVASTVNANREHTAAAAAAATSESTEPEATQIAPQRSSP